ncbi:HNH endonuclease [Microcoleus sp. PH2017_32_RDM_D_A]
MSSHPELSSRVATLLKRQAGKCVLCELSFKYGDLWEVDHVIRTSRGGKDEYSNWQLLHRHCHDLKTATDGDVRLENWDDNPF